MHRAGLIAPTSYFEQTQKSPVVKLGLFERWCPEAESNHRHEDFQSSALPTELSGQSLSPRCEEARIKPLSRRCVNKQLTIFNN